MSGWTLTPDGLRVLQVSASAWMSLLMSAFLGFLALTGMCSATHAGRLPVHLACWWAARLLRVPPGSKVGRSIGDCHVKSRPHFPAGL